MKRAALLISDGSEEIESLTPVDVLRRAGADCRIISVRGLYISGSRDITVKTDELIENADLSAYDAIIIPGGMPGARIISENAKAVSEIKKAMVGGRLVAAICASPAVVLAAHGLTAGRKLTCYPAENFIAAVEADGGRYTGKVVERDKNLITASGPKAAMDFSLVICEYLGIVPAF